MVTVTGFSTVKTEEGDFYVRLVLQGGLEMVKSEKTGKFYAHSKKCTISSTFDEEIAQQMVGQELPGNIVKQEVEPYDYELDNGEKITLKHRWVYTDESAEELAVKDLVSEVSNLTAKQNGTKEAVTA